ncbi:MAG TPA: exopolysaccharide transport family protein [Rhizomicrobium sp.]|jgi:succinoglycan biosynthesis transport protein ExoP|nr:exopolysaccharide transport family protein [Rhizomicrobium sp.]
MSFQGINPHSAAPPDARNGPPPAPSELADILAGLRARSGLILRITVLVVAVAIVTVCLMPTRYSSSAVVMLDPRKNTVADLSAVLSALPTDPASLQNQIQILQSRDLAAEVIAKLKLYDDPEFNGALQQSVGGALLASLNPRHWFSDGPQAVDPNVERDAIIDAFLAHLSAETLGLSTTVTVTFTSRDAGKAARIADAVVETYVGDLVEAKLRASDSTSAWLTQRIRDLGNQVQIQEAAALTYRAQHNLDSSAAGTSLIEAQLGGINGQIVQARADLSAKVAVYNQVQSLMQAGNPADISQVIASPLIIQLRTQQADLLRQQAALAIPYGPRHPKRIAVDNQLKDLDQKIDEEAARIASALASDVAVARAQLGSLQGSLHSTQHQASGQDLTAVKLRALEAAADSSRKLYESFLGRLTGIQDQDGLQYPDAHVISRAPVPSAPSSPPRLLIVAASLPAGLLLGCLAALLTLRFAGAPRAAVARTRPVRRPVPAPAPAYRGPPILAEVPGALAEGAADHIVDWPASPFARAITALLARVAPPAGAGSGRIVAVTTSESQNAGSTVAVALARAAAKAGLRTIIVDGHLLRPAIAEATGARVQAGLLEVLAGKTTLNRALMRDPRSNALILGGLQPARDPAAALASPRTQELFAHLRAICDLVVVAAPPVMASAEAPSFARLADAVVMVARPEEGPRPGLSKALQTLGQWRSAPVGMVLVR